MLRRFSERLADFVTTHNRIVILVVLVLTAGVVAGVGQNTGGADEAGLDDDEIGDTEVYQAYEYIQDRYGDGEDANAQEPLQVYVRDEDGSVLTREGLLTALDYQIEASSQDAVADALVAGGIDGPPNVVARQLADDPDADLETQRAALEAASGEEVRQVVESTFAGGEDARFFLPADYEAGSADAKGMRLTFTVETSGNADDEAVPDEVYNGLYDTAQGYEDPDVFTRGPYALADLNDAFLSDALWLVLPPILLFLVIVLGFAYRDVTDVVIGFTGTIVALLWTFGLMGWIGILSQQTALIAPVLIAALSIDFGFHVFMRYREGRGPEEGIREALERSTAAVTVAFLLVTATAAIGFLSNLTSPSGLIRQLGIAITLGVVSALLIFTTLVPALKVSADGLWERFGFDRHGTPLGKGRYLSRVLATGATAARRAAIPVLVVALLVGAAGGLAFTELDRQPFQQGDLSEVPDWQTNLPGPMAVEFHESDAIQNFVYADSAFQSDQQGASEGGTGFTQLLIRDDDGVATADAMGTMAAGHDAAENADGEIVLRQGGEVNAISPLSLMQEAAARDDSFAQAFDAADTNGDSVPDQNVVELYDALYEAAPDQAGRVLERTDDGEYASALVMVPSASGFDPARGDVMTGIAAEMADASGLSVTAVGFGTINDAELTQVTDGLIVTMLLALSGVALALIVVYRLTHGTALLGALTVVPIVLALGLVFGGMYLLGEPLTLFTALLVSITIGLGIDYNIHVSDRFAQELEAGRNVETALREAVTGTGGALLGSAITSGGAFALLLLVPEPQFSSFGVIATLALSISFVLSVFVLPSLLWLWASQTEVDFAADTAMAPGDDD